MVNTVNTFEEARNYPVLYNSSELLLNANQDIFYVKSVDGLGKSTVTTYKFEKIENEKPLDPANFVTVEQFVSLESKIDKLLKELGGVSNGQ